MGTDFNQAGAYVAENVSIPLRFDGNSAKYRSNRA